MKTIFPSIIVLLVMLVVTQTASAIPTLATTADFSALNKQLTTSQNASSRWHAMFRSIRNSMFRSILDLRERNIVDEVDIEMSLIGANDSLGFDTIRVTTASIDNGFIAIDGLITEKDRVNVPEPSLLALIALGLVGFGLAGFTGRKKNH